MVLPAGLAIDCSLDSRELRSRTRHAKMTHSIPDPTLDPGSEHIEWLEDEGLLSLGGGDPPGFDESLLGSGQAQDDWSAPLDWERLNPPKRLENELRRTWPDGPTLERVLYPDDRSIDQRLHEQGFDVAAWYRQIHFNGYDWGIFVKGSAVVHDSAAQARSTLRLSLISSI